MDEMHVRSTTVMLKSNVVLPLVFRPITLKVRVASRATGTPVMEPVVLSKVRPSGRAGEMVKI